MGKNLLQEAISGYEDDIEKLRATHETLRELYLSDGVIDADEAAALERIDKKIATIEGYVSDLRHDYEKNKKDWEARADDLSETQSRMFKITAAGHTEAASITADYKNILTCRKEQRWRDASTALDALMVRIAPIYAQVDAEGAAKAVYLPRRADFDTRVSRLDRVNPKPGFLSDGLTDIKGRIGPVDAAVASKDYSEADTLLQTALDMLEALEKKHEQFEYENQDFETALKGIEDRLFAIIESTLKRYATQRDEIKSTSDEMYALIAVPDLASARPLLFELIPKVEALYPDLIEQEGSRDEFFHAYPPLQKRAKGVEGCTVKFAPDEIKQMHKMQREVEAFADAEDYVAALKSIVFLTYVIEELEELMGEREEFEARKAALSDELALARKKDPKTVYLEPRQAELEKLLPDIEKAEADEDFYKALRLLTGVEAKVAEIFEVLMDKKKTCLERKKSFDRQFAEASRDVSKETTDEFAPIAALMPTIANLLMQEDWNGALVKLDKAFDLIAAFNKEMLKEDAGSLVADLPDAALDIIGLSPDLTQSLQDLAQQGWQVKIGEAGKGTCVTKADKTITIDPDELTDPANVAQALAHEVGHAEDHAAPDWSSRDAYIQSMLLSEAEAVMENIRIQRELLANGHADIGVGGSRVGVPKYQEIYDDYENDNNEERALLAIAEIFGPLEKPSTDKTVANYIEFYGKQYDEQTGGGTP